MNQNTVAVNDDDEIVFKIKRSVIAEALRSDFEMPIPVTDANIDGEDIAPALREVRTYCKDATEKRDPQLICAKAQAAAAKSATAEGEAGGKKL